MMLCSGLSSTLLLAASCFLVTSAVNVTSIYNVTAISKGRVITFDSLSVHRLSCERGVIIVESAQNDILDIIRKSCDGKKECDINTNITSHPGICNFLDTTYSCFPENRSVACEGSQAKLQCGEGQVIVVYWADYGRHDNTICPNPQFQDGRCSSPNSTEYVTKSCNWQNNCSVEAENLVFGDPCKGTTKYLQVVYVCQAGSPKTCPPGWTWFGGRCFFFEENNKNWTEAETSCQTGGGNLTSFHSIAEYTFIRKLVRRTGSNTNSWVGGRKNGTVWMWSDGSKFDFPHWAINEPSGGNENCMEINHGGDDHVNNTPCDYRKPSVCVRHP